jgi:hypothetical protein
MFVDKETWQPTLQQRSENTVEIDDNMVEIICTLNRKGYHTRACCEGHDDPYGYYCYVLFTDSLPSLPYGARSNKTHTLIEYKYQWTVPVKRVERGEEERELRREFKKWVLGEINEWSKKLLNKKENLH